MEERKVEQALLGAILKAPKNFGNVSASVKPEDFTWQPYRAIYQAMLDLHNESINIDTVTIGDKLELKDIALHDAPSINGRAALVYLRDDAIPEHYGNYIGIINKNAKNRQIMAILNDAATWVTRGRNPADVVHDITSKLGTIDSASVDTSTITFSEAMSRAHDKTQQAASGHIGYIKTGFTNLDKLIVGLSAPDFTIIAARPGVGKTAFLASLVYNIMKREIKHMLFFSLEMGSDQVAMRFMSMDSGINFHDQRIGKVDWDKYYQSMGSLTSDQYPLYLNDLPRITPNKIRSEIRRLPKVDVLFVDYLQLAGADEHKEQRHLEVASISRGLKQIAKEFNIPVVCAAQLSRAANQRAQDDQRPILTDLGESGALERDADNVIFLHRKDGAMDTEVIVAKQRNGPVGGIHLTYLGEKTKFVNQVGV